MQNAQAELIQTESKRDSRGNRIYSEERKRELVAEWRASGLTQRAFAQKVGVKYGTLISWTCKRRAVGLSERAGAMAFKEVTMAPMARSSGEVSLEVILFDGTVVRGSDAAELAVLVRKLRRQ